MWIPDWDSSTSRREPSSDETSDSAVAGLSVLFREGPKVIILLYISEHFPGGGSTRDREIHAFGWASAPDWGQASHKEGAHGNLAALPRDSCVQEQLLCQEQQGCGHCLLLLT